nr:l-amino-acid oxidase [Quercus suber]
MALHTSRAVSVARIDSCSIPCSREGNPDLVSFQNDIVAEAGGMHNVRIMYNAALDGELSLHFGSCEVLLGSSAPVTIVKRQQRRWKAAADIMDAEGPWFDGVAYLKEKEPDEVFVAHAKSKEIGIVGGGMSGLMTSHLLQSAGFYNWTIMEASQRIGGRVHTSYLNGTTPDEYQYQGM